MTRVIIQLHGFDGENNVFMQKKGIHISWERDIWWIGKYI